MTVPFTRERLASGFVGLESQLPLLQAGILGQRMGRISDVVQAGTNAFTAQTTQIANAADRARQTYLDLLDEFKTTEDLRLRQEAINASRASSGPGFAERESIELQNVLKAANDPRLKTDEKRRELIRSNVYNPVNDVLRGLFTG